MKILDKLARLFRGKAKVVKARTVHLPRLEKPLRYVKQHGTEAEISNAKVAASYGYGKRVHEIANEIQERYYDL